MEKMPQQGKVGAESNKQDLWEKQVTLLNEIGKEDLPIDNEKLIETIAALNVTGIPTIASNAGHAVEERHTGDTAYPWILISTEQDPNVEISVYAKVESLLSEFYESRGATNDVKLRIDDVFENQFTLSSVDEDILQRDQIGDLTQQEKDDLVSALPERQQEMYAFGHFLKSKFFAN